MILGKLQDRVSSFRTSFVYAHGHHDLRTSWAPSVVGLLSTGCDHMPPIFFWVPLRCMRRYTSHNRQQELLRWPDEEHILVMCVLLPWHEVWYQEVQMHPPQQRERVHRSLGVEFQVERDWWVSHWCGLAHDPLLREQLQLRSRWAQISATFWQEYYRHAFFLPNVCTAFTVDAITRWRMGLSHKDAVR